MNDSANKMNQNKLLRHKKLRFVEVCSLHRPCCLLRHGRCGSLASSLEIVVEIDVVGETGAVAEKRHVLAGVIFRNGRTSRYISIKDKGFSCLYL